MTQIHHEPKQHTDTDFQTSPENACADTTTLLTFRSAELESPGRLPRHQHHQIHLAYKLRALELVEVEADVQHGLECHKVGWLVKKTWGISVLERRVMWPSPCLCLCLFVCSDIIVQLSSTACWNASFLDQRYKNKQTNIKTSYPSGLDFSCDIILSCVTEHLTEVNKIFMQKSLVLSLSSTVTAWSTAQC